MARNSMRGSSDSWCTKIETRKDILGVTYGFFCEKFAKWLDTDGGDKCYVIQEKERQCRLLRFGRERWQGK